MLDERFTASCAEVPAPGNPHPASTRPDQALRRSQFGASRCPSRGVDAHTNHGQIAMRAAELAKAEGAAVDPDAHTDRIIIASQRSGE